MPSRRETDVPRAGLNPQAGAVVLRPINRIALALFRRFIAKRRLRASFRAVRLAFADRLPDTKATTNVIFYLNHPSWWDPLLCMVLAQRFAPGQDVYAPIDADQLKRYAVLRPLGLFPVQTGTVRGTVQFFRVAETVLARGDVLALTPQGAFTDPRMRPAGLKPGLGALLARLEQRGLSATVIPVALEYTFWNQRSPEALVALGRPFGTAPAMPPRTADVWTALLDEQLTTVQDELSALSQHRDEDAFQIVLQGSRGAAGLYGRWQRLRGFTGDHQNAIPKSEQRAKPRLRANKS